MSDGTPTLRAGRYKLEVVRAPHLPAYMTVDNDCLLIASGVVFAPSSPVPGVIIVTATPATDLDARADLLPPVAARAHNA